MEIMVNIKFEQLLKVINRLPVAKIIQLKAELSEKSISKLNSTSPVDFQKFY
jgi:hypothetical protein